MFIEKSGEPVSVSVLSEEVWFRSQFITDITEFHHKLSEESNYNGSNEWADGNLGIYAIRCTHLNRALAKYEKGCDTTHPLNKITRFKLLLTNDDLSLLE